MCASPVFGADSYRAYLAVESALQGNEPGTAITQGAAVSPSAEATLTWTRAATDAMRAAELTLAPGSAQMDVGWRALEPDDDEVRGTGSGAFDLDDLAVPATSFATWTGSGSAGDLFSTSLGSYLVESTDAEFSVFGTVGDAGQAGPIGFDCVVPEDFDWGVSEVNPAAWGYVDVVSPPTGVPFACRRAGDNATYSVYLDLDVDLPTTPVVFASALNPAVNASVVWSLESAAALRSSDWVIDTSTVSLALVGTTGSVETTIPLTFDAATVPATGVASWSAVGSWGSIPTTTAGDLVVAASAVEIQIGQDATFACSPSDTSDLALGSVTVSEKVLDKITVASAAKITGIVRVGTSVTAAAAFRPAGTKLSYQWLRNGVAIRGATAATYAIVVGDLGTSLSVRVSAAKSDAVGTASTSPAVTVQAGVLTLAGPVKMTGKVKAGKKVKASAPTLAGASVSYQWLQNGKAIKKATKVSYKVAKSLKRKKLSVRVTYKRAGFTPLIVLSTAKKVS